MERNALVKKIENIKENYQKGLEAISEANKEFNEIYKVRERIMIFKNDEEIFGLLEAIDTLKNGIDDLARDF